MRPEHPPRDILAVAVACGLLVLVLLTVHQCIRWMPVSPAWSGIL